ncbi:MAG: phenylacetate-CoA oxygenase subunit PaaJ [Gemmatimonadaceae bacterium]|nr:phenylacetate-CoA oxygenase subunit PaaJ [Gemmatimonadaceae bacterium]
MANADLLEILRTVKDPEIPVLDVVELGVVRDVREESGKVVVEITPTYSGCPALQMMEDEIIAALKAGGFPDVEVRKVYSPAWTTDWMSAESKAKLKAYGVAPPHVREAEPLIVLERARHTVACPYCGSSNTEEKSEFGSTACKSINFCNSCHQPFDSFKSI